MRCELAVQTTKDRLFGRDVGMNQSMNQGMNHVFGSINTQSVGNLFKHISPSTPRDCQYRVWNTAIEYLFLSGQKSCHWALL